MVELIAPVGNWPMLMAAIAAKADGVYFGVKELNMRITAKNFELTEIKKVVNECHKKKVKAYLTLNTIIYDNELEKVKRILIEAKKADIDAVIAWDLSVIKEAKNLNIPVHLSTQASVSNTESAKMYYMLGVKRVVLARELTLKQIKNLIKQIKKEKLNLETEVFIHGAMCVSISGRCFLSQSMFNKSANRGDCLQPCRRPYKVINEETKKELRICNNYILSPKDLCALPFLDNLIDTKIDAFKIEGRNKSPEYVQVTVNSYKKAINTYKKNKKQFKKIIPGLIKRLETVYNRGFHEGFYLGTPTSEDFTGIEGSKATEIKLYSGYIRNFYKKIRVAEIKIENNPIKVGDEIRIIGNKTGTFKQRITSMEINHKKVKEAKKGQRVAIKTKKTARENDKVFLIKINEV